jgi:hypothetical protein
MRRLPLRQFLTADGRRLDRHGAARIVRRVARPAGIAKNVGPHTLRHAFLTAALDTGVPLAATRRAGSSLPRRPRAPPCDTTGPAPAWTGTPPTSSPPTPPEQSGKPAVSPSAPHALPGRNTRSTSGPPRAGSAMRASQHAAQSSSLQTRARSGHRVDVRFSGVLVQAARDPAGLCDACLVVAWRVIVVVWDRNCRL